MSVIVMLPVLVALIIMVVVFIIIIVVVRLRRFRLWPRLRRFWAGRWRRPRLWLGRHIPARQQRKPAIAALRAFRGQRQDKAPVDVRTAGCQRQDQKKVFHCTILAKSVAKPIEDRATAIIVITITIAPGRGTMNNSSATTRHRALSASSVLCANTSKAESIASRSWYW